ncbi:hypothetical protein HCA84_02490 [Listeria booriae]|uniref:hypothetical protein n=1 Tax=Listeria booriae TaxID=1552123 RepID=UPI00162A7D8D|nr:hypothetical protein [Listeria booriae]MBC1893128.1 hypothetical protein [Listeria booriae]MBC1974532.1 hypothetical protein [Listeria booriae]MBC2031824.1 hypothetical protein [Listeria booriae]
MNATVILPNNKKRQLKIMYDIIALQKIGVCNDRVKRLQSELDYLMTERERVRRFFLATQIIEEVTEGVELDKLSKRTLKKLRDKKIRVHEIARYYKVGKNVVETRLKKLDLRKSLEASK